MNSGVIDWSTRRDAQVNVSGVAQNAKMGALLMTGPEDAILIKGLSEWDSATVGKEVTIEAVVRRVAGYPKAEVSQGHATQGTASGGDIWVLELKHYRVAD